MANDQKSALPQDSVNSLLVEFGTRLNEVEEKQRIARDRIILLGKNVVETREEINEEISRIKGRLTNLDEEMKKMKQLNKRIINEFGNFARKSELNMLERQYKIFEPLEFVRMSEVKGIIKEELEKLKK